MADAYESGAVNSFADLKTAIENKLVAEGWLLSSGVLSANGGYFTLTASLRYLELAAGTGQSAGALTGAAPGRVRIGSYTSDPITWPATYHLHINASPAEVYVELNHDVTRFHNLSFGVSPAPGNETGIWINGEAGHDYPFTSATVPFRFEADTGTLSESWAPSMPNFGTCGAGILASAITTAPASRFPSYFVHANGAWYPSNSIGAPGGTFGAAWLTTLIRALPSSANQTLVLLPVVGMFCAADFGMLPLVQLHAARHCRIDNHADGQIVTYGSERWKVYPLYKRDMVVRSPNNGTFSHTGTLGHAVRYFGP